MTSICAQFPLNDLAIIDSETTDNYIKTTAPSNAHQKTTKSIEVQVPNGETINSNTITTLQLEQLPENARKSYVFKDISQNLLSVGKLCDNEYLVLFTKTNSYVLHKNKIIVKGVRDKLDGMYYTNLRNNITSLHKSPTPFDLQKYLTKYKSTNKINNILTNTKLKEIINWYHACFHSPVKSTWIKAIENGHFHT